MARYRQVETSFWTDGFVLKLTPEEKYFYLYLMTNPHTTQCGIYELPERMAEVETGYNRETLAKLRDRFSRKYKKIVYSEETEEYCIVNWLKYNSLKSPKVKACIDKELLDVKNKSLIDYLYGMDSLSIDSGEEEEKEEEQEREEEQEKKSKSKPDKYKDVPAELIEPLKAFEDMRKKIKAPLTDHAFGLLLKNLNKLSGGDIDTSIAILEQSIMNSWKGIFELKQEKRKAKEISFMEIDF